MKAAAHIKTPAQYIANLPPDRRETVQALDRAIRRAAPELKPHIYFRMLGYGPYKHVTSSGGECDWCAVALASQKNYFSLYLCASDEGQYLAEENRKRLGKVSVGRSCVRFKKLQDLDLKVAMELVKKTAVLRKKIRRAR